MGILSKLFGGGERAASASPSAPAEPAECRHTQLVPRWDSVEDMGQADKATEYICSSCGEHFAPEQAHEIRGY